MAAWMYCVPILAFYAGDTHRMFLLWNYIPQILVADGVVYAGTQDGYLYALRVKRRFQNLECMYSMLLTISFL